MYCSPKNKNNKNTCFSNKALVKIAKEYNIQHKDSIQIPTKINPANRTKLWNNISVAMKRYTPCTEDFCLLDTALVKNIKDKEIQEDTFRPEKPEEWYKNKTAWLSTLDIDIVMKQYEKMTDFLFLGPVPIDFDTKIGFGLCIANELCNLNLKALYKKGIRKIGVVFNLDPHYMSGSHWTALYANLDNGGIYYFDSYAIKPPSEVEILMDRIKKQGNELITEGIININNLEKDHSQTSKYQIINKKTIKLKNPANFKENNIVVFNTNKQLNIECINKINNIDGDICKLDKNIDIDICGQNITMTGFQSFFNDVRFQYKNSECGVYSMYFITQFLEGNTFDKIIHNIIDDDTINKKRDYFYRPNIDVIAK